jgi:uncharacterized protein (UPF0332 family)
VKPETTDQIAKALHCLGAANQIIAIQLSDVAAKEAYLAIYHAAQAYIFEVSGRANKTHRGVRVVFSQLARNDPRLVPECSALLARAYQYKETADYAVGERALVTVSEAQDLIDRVRGCVDRIASLPAPNSTPSGQDQDKDPPAP